MPTSFETFINNELPLRVSTLDAPVSGDIPVFTGVGKLTEAKSTSELGLATTSYVDTAITKVWKDQGNYDVSGGTAWPTSANTIGAVPIKAGFLWVVAGAAVDGTTLIGGKIVSNGDTIRALVDAATNSGADWGVNEANLGYTPENKANKAIDLTLPDDTKYPTTLAVSDALSDKQNTLADVITAGTYGSSTQYPVVTFNAKGIATGVTLQTVPTPTFTDATFSVQKNGSPSIAATWSLSELTASRVHTYPNKNINFGDLPNVATTDSNNLSGTRNRILGGNSTTLSGTDNIAIGCSDNTNISASGRAVVILARRLSATYLTPHSLVLGTSAYDVAAFGASWFAAAVKVQTALCTRVVIASGSVYSITSDGENPTPTNSLPALLLNAFMSARHEFDFIITFGEDGITIPSRTCFAKRTVYVVRRVTAEVYPDYTPVWDMSIATPQPDVTLGLGSSTVTIAFTLDSAANRLIPTISATSNPSFLDMQVSCRVDSHYNRNV